MKKSMRMVSVLMSAVMAMSAMSALAAGASAADFHGPKHDPRHSYIETYDNMNSSSIPVYIKTDGINGRLKGVKVSMDYEFVAKADSAAVREINAKHPEYYVSFPDVDGNVIVHVHEVHTCTADTGDNAVRFDIPANTDLNGMLITLGYDSHISGYHYIGGFNLACSNINWQPSQIMIDLNATSWGLDYDVTGKIYLINGSASTLVYNQKA